MAFGDLGGAYLEQQGGNGCFVLDFSNEDGQLPRFHGSFPQKKYGAENIGPVGFGGG